MKTGLVVEGGAMRGHLYGRRAGCISGAGHQSGWRDRRIRRCGSWMLLCIRTARAQHPLLFEIYERSPVYEFPVTSEDG